MACKTSNCLYRLPSVHTPDSAWYNHRSSPWPRCLRRKLKGCGPNQNALNDCIALRSLTLVHLMRFGGWAQVKSNGLDVEMWQAQIKVAQDWRKNLGRQKRDRWLVKTTRKVDGVGLKEVVEYGPCASCVGESHVFADLAISNKAPMEPYLLNRCCCRPEPQARVYVLPVHTLLQSRDLAHHERDR